MVDRTVPITTSNSDNSNSNSNSNSKSTTKSTTKSKTKSTKTKPKLIPNSQKQKRKKSMSSSWKSSVDEVATTTMSSTVDRSTVVTTNQQSLEHDRKSAVTVHRLKIIILTFFTLTAAGVTAAFCVYRHYNKQAQNTEFIYRFQEDATNMLASLGGSIDSTLGATDAYAMSMLAYAKATNQTYPFVTIGDFAVQAGKLLKNSRAKFITTYQIVEESERLEWEEYSATHNGWVEESIELQSHDRSYHGPEITDEFIEENYVGDYNLIHGYDEQIYGWENNTGGVYHEGPYLPMWQNVPVVPTYPMYNWDLSTAVFKDPWHAVVQTHLVTITEPYMIAWPDDYEKQAENEAEADWIKRYLDPDENPLEPISDIYYPVIVEALQNVHHRDEDHSNYSTESNKLGAYLALTFYWRDALRNLLPRGSGSVVVVFENQCDVPPFAYQISGPVPIYLGTGNYNSTFEDNPELSIVTNLMDVWEFGIKESSYTGIPINEDVCPFVLRVYPAESSFEEFLEGNDQTVFIVLILVLSVAVLTIAFTLVFFFLYDRLVRNEIRSKINLLDAKRNFVRFVSHEVRTPLNTVSMGLALIHQDLLSRERQMNREHQKLLEQRSNENISENNSESSDSSTGAAIVVRNIVDSAKTATVTTGDLARWSSLALEVSHNADVAVGVLNDLLNIDKIQMGAFKLEMEILPGWDLIEQTTMEFKMMATKQKTDLKLDLTGLAESKDVETAITTTSMLPPSVLNQKLVGDSQRIQQVLRNLLSNAIKFSKNRSVTMKVSVRDPISTTSNNGAQELTEFKLTDGSQVGLSMSGRLVVDVTDTGVGMTQVQLETVFDVGVQFNANKLQAGGGSGLGLAFAKAIVEQHGGSLRAFSDGRDQGTTFRLDLPLYHSSDVDGAGTNNNNNGKTLAPSSSAVKAGSKLETTTIAEETLEPMRILVVDDARMNRKLLIRLLESNGHSCGEAENGQALIDTVKACLVHYDCILVDYEMPVMNGPEACKAIREMGYTGFVVGVTGNLLPEDIGYFMDCGADAVLPKPFKYKDLEQLLIEQGLFSVS